MNVYVLLEYDSDDNSSVVIGTYSSIDNVNLAITGKTFHNEKFDDSKLIYGVDSRVTNYRGIFYRIVKTTLDNEKG